MGAHPAKKVAAAVAAVLQYLTDVEAAPMPVAAAPTAPPPTVLTPWGLAGRQESMALRDLWQRRIPKSW
ncbi:MAG: hypothetical protein IH608_12820 [Proteobacteria bacterium]|nr:hypothetical protein [Pseudomonadota bacterium]